MSTKWLNRFSLAAAAAAATLIALHNLDRPTRGLLNASYAPTAELYRALDARFTQEYAQAARVTVPVQVSNGGSSRQAQAVLDGLAADVVTLALPSDVDVLRKQGLIPAGWERRLPNQSQPYSSTIVFVVRRGNPKGVRDWPDLVRPGVEVVTPDPKTSGNGKLSLLAAWGSVLARKGTEAQARDYVTRLYRHVPSLDATATESAATFVYNQVGDVHLAWESEALEEARDSKGDLQVVYPPVSIRAEPSVAWVDANVAAHGTSAAAQAYLRFLFSDEAQEIIAEQGYRPINPAVAKRHERELPALDLFPITLIAKDWNDAQAKFFSDHGLFDLIRRTKGA